ncbi:DUF5681 domain-containing protein [Belnapia rosea]|uniref:DUF5681 domain-containing protein n=1 Tax=Belnapia rosea TaxID=938405 RepID=A0A1G6YUN6_9PROT|nr:DUF5681 domain-containing protein [Belnapia rosea]SDD94048.1 hypothetical protein SAMN04487779_101513 [Belnapia rosea]
MSAEPETTDLKQTGGRFEPGQSGNPSGRPRGTRHKALLALNAIGAEGAEAVLRKVVEDAQAGDMRAAEILLRRVWPERKGRLVEFDLPPIAGATDAVKAAAAIVEAVASGDLTPDEAQAVAGVVEIQRRAIETAELAERIAALEARAGQ